LGIGSFEKEDAVTCVVVLRGWAYSEPYSGFTQTINIYQYAKSVLLATN
jgi:hypothetical protein